MNTDPHSPVVLEFELAQPLRAIEDQLGAWLWAWLWPASAGDMLRPPPLLASGLRDEPAFLVVDRSNYTEQARTEKEQAERQHLLGHTLITFDEPERPSYDELNASNETVLLVTVDGAPPARLTVQDLGEGCLVRVTLHPLALACRSDELLLRGEIHVLHLTLPVVRCQLSRPSLASLMPGTPTAVARGALGRYFLGPAMFQVTDGTWVSPRLRQWTRSVPGAVSRIAEILGGQTYADPLEDPSGLLERMMEPARAIADGLRPDGGLGPRAPTRRSFDWGRRSTPARATDHTRADGPLDGVQHLLLLVTGDREIEARKGRYSELLAALREGPPGDWDAAMLQAEPFGRRLWAPSPATMPIAALALRGARRQRALPRFLEHGPWKVEPLGDDGLLVRASASSGPDGAVCHQREVAMGWIHGLIPPLQPELGDVASYDPDTRSVLVDTRHPHPRLNAFAEVAAWARDRAEDPNQPVDHVIAPFADPYLARLWLPYLWLCEIQVWTVQDETWTRIDRGYQPRWGRPGWFDWEAT